MTPNHGLKYPKCVMTGMAFTHFWGIRAIWMHNNRDIYWKIYETNLYTIASTDQLVKFCGSFSIFHTPPMHPGSMENCQKKPNHIVKFDCGSYCINLFFLRKSDKKFQKITKITKKIFASQKNVKTTPWYLYFDICFVEPIIFSKSYLKKLFSKF